MKITERTIRISRLTQLAAVFLLLALLAGWGHRHFKHVEVEKYVMGSDMEGYYQYLPYFFLRDWDDFDRLPWAKPYEEGKTLNVYTCGVAIMQSPFFLAGHATTLFFQLEDRDGYSNVYFSFIFLAGIFYALMGLIFIYKALLRHFSEKTALWSAALLFFATNLFYYSVFSPGMSHVYSFALLAGFIYFVPVFYEKPTVKSTVLLIVPLALATLIRPTNLIAALYFLLYGIGNFRMLKNRIVFLLRRWPLLLIMLLTGVLVFVPQMAYWYKVTGRFLVYSYQSEGFPFWASPHISTVLFGARNGWFIYTPLMLLASLSLIYLLVKNRYSAPAIFIPMVLIVYINGSWWAPTFSAAAGYRALIEFLPLMAAPLAFVIQKVLNLENKLSRNAVIFLLFFFIFYNIQFSFKYEPWLWWDTEWQWSYLLRIFKF